VNLALLTHSVAQRRDAGDQRHHKREPARAGRDLPAPAPYFPEGGVAAPPYMIVNPRTMSPGNGQPNELIGPATAEWIKPRASHEQGIGVDPNRRWARQFHSETYDFNSLDVLPFPDQLGPAGLINQDRPAKAGWSVPKNYRQYQQSPADDSVGSGPINTSDPASMAFAIGWGFLG
jgi:hypothetical protein